MEISAELLRIHEPLGKIAQSGISTPDLKFPS